MTLARLFQYCWGFGINGSYSYPGHMTKISVTNFRSRDPWMFLTGAATWDKSLKMMDNETSEYDILTAYRRAYNKCCT